jgi:hypothetical protein
VQTLGHATSGTFPAGGPAEAGTGGGPGAPVAFGRQGGATAGGMPAAPPAGAASGTGLAAGAGGPGVAGAPAAAGPGLAGGAAGGQAMSGGPFSGDTRSLAQAVAYARAHGGGTVAVSSQSGAAGQLIATGADVAAIGGFSGRESQVSIAWLADAVQSGQIRWVLTSGDGMPQDGRIGASQVMAAVARVGTKVGSVSGLYDLQGKASALRALAP